VQDGLHFDEEEPNFWWYQHQAEDLPGFVPTDADFRPVCGFRKATLACTEGYRLEEYLRVAGW
jgi:hypothetical protein